jgi:hypothetical protein
VIRCIALLVLAATILPAQRNELSLQFGGTLTQRRTILLSGRNFGIPGLEESLTEDNGYGGGIVYRVRLVRFGPAVLMAELPIFIVQATNTDVIPLLAERFFGNTSGVSGFITPGAVLRFAPDSIVSPYAFFGAGYARVVEAQLVDTFPFRADFVNGGTWAINYGGGADLRLARFLAIRGELRNFYTGSTSIAGGLPPEETRQRNTLLLTGGLVFRF